MAVVTEVPFAGGTMWSYDGQLYDKYEDIPFKTKHAYETSKKRITTAAKSTWEGLGNVEIGDKQVGKDTQHLLKGAAQIAAGTIQDLDQQEWKIPFTNINTGIPTFGNLAVDTLRHIDTGLTHFSKYVEKEHGIYAPTTKLASEIAVDYLASGGAGKVVKGTKRLASQVDNLIPPPTGLAYATVGVGDGHLLKQAALDKLPSTATPLQSVSGINPGNVARGSTRIAGLKALVQADPPIKDVPGFIETGKKELIETKPQKIQRYLEQGPSKYLKSKYKNSQAGYWNAKKLSKNPKLLNQVIEKHEEVTELFNKWKANPNSVNQRTLYDKIGESYFDDSALIYGGHTVGKQARKKLVEVSQWFSKDHWHHIFGNKEIGEFMLTEIAQDPLVGVNLFKHMKKRGLTSSGVADNILIMKELGHSNYHDFLKQIGIQPRFGNRAPVNFEDFGQEISKVTRGEARATKTFTTDTGEIIQKGTAYAKDPEAINELFTMIDAYADLNKWMRKKFKEGAITVVEPVGTKGQRRVVPNGYKPKPNEKITVYDLTANKSGKSQFPEVYADKAGRIKKVVKKHSN